MYRLGGADELFHIGWEDYLSRGGVCAVEWSENVAEAIEDGAVRVSIVRGDGDNDRIIAIEGVDLLKSSRWRPPPSPPPWRSRRTNGCWPSPSRTAG